MGARPNGGRRRRRRGLRCHGRGCGRGHGAPDHFDLEGRHADALAVVHGCLSESAWVRSIFQAPASFTKVTSFTTPPASAERVATSPRSCTTFTSPKAAGLEGAGVAKSSKAGSFCTEFPDSSETF